MRACLWTGVVLFSMTAVAARPAERAKDVAVQVIGTVAVTKKTVAGKEVREVAIAVTEAKDADGKAVKDLAGKSIPVTGPKVADVEKLDKREVTAKGVLKADKKSLEVTEVAERVRPPEAPIPPR